MPPHPFLITWPPLTLTLLFTAAAPHVQATRHEQHRHDREQAARRAEAEAGPSHSGADLEDEALPVWMTEEAVIYDQYLAAVRAGLGGRRLSGLPVELGLVKRVSCSPTQQRWAKVLCVCRCLCVYLFVVRAIERERERASARAALDAPPLTSCSPTESQIIFHAHNSLMHHLCFPHSLLGYF